MSDVRVVLTPELLEEILPLRGEGKPVAVRPIDTKKLFKDITSNDSQFIAVRDGTLGKSGDFKAEAFTAGCFMNVSRSMTGGYSAVTAKLVDRWMQLYGAAYTVEQITLLRAHGGKWANHDMVVFNETWTATSAKRAREWLAHAPDYDAALTRAKELLAAVPEAARKPHAVLFAYLFPDHKPFLADALDVERNAGLVASDLLVTCVTTKEEFAKLFREANSWDCRNGTTLALRFGADGFEMLKQRGQIYVEEGPLQALLPYVGEEPAQALTQFIGTKRFMSAVTAWFVRNPELAKQVLPAFAAAQKKKAIKESAALILSQAEKAGGEPASSEMVPAAAAAAAAASDDALPKVLAAPPWRQKKRVALLSGDVKTVAVPVVCPEKTGTVGGSWSRHFRAEALDVSQPPGTYRNYHKATVLLDPVDSIPLFGEAALPGLIAGLPTTLKNVADFAYSGDPTSYLEQYMVIATVDLAMPLTRLVDRKDLRPLAFRWAAKWPRHMFHGILPTLFGAPSSDRDQAIAMLKELQRSQGDDALLALAKEAGVETAIGAWLSRDLLEDAPRAPGSIPKFLDVSKLPRPELANGKGALPDTAIRNLLEMLTFAGTLNPIYAGVAEVKGALDQASLDRFAIALAEAWIAAGARAANGWVADAVGLLGSTEVVPWLKDQLGGLIARKERAATLRMVQALLRIDTPAARMYVLKQVRHGQQAWLKREGAELLEAHLDRTGMTMDAYEASAVPPMPETIDFGDGKPLSICLDEQLRPSLRTKDGERLKRAPSAKGDAAVDWPRIKEEAELVVKLEQGRLERLTSSGETFAAESFRTMLAHPILRALAQGMVFMNGTTTFRVAEDGTFANEEDEPFELPKDATISVMHPIDVDKKVVAAWGERFSDYKLIQPVEQLSREVFTLTAEEKASRTLERYATKEAYAGKILALRQRGWTLDAQMDGEISGVRRNLSTLSGGETSAYVYIDPPIRLRDETKGEHKLGSLHLSVPLSELAEKAASELCLAMAQVTQES